MPGPYRIDNAEVRDAVTDELNTALVGQQIQVVVEDTTTPYPIQDAAADPITGSLLTVQAPGTVPRFYINTGTPANLYLDWYHAASGARGAFDFNRVLRDATLAAQAAAEAALVETTAAKE